MIIEANEKFTKEEMDEVFEISVRRSQIYKSPEKKYPGVFKESKKNLITGIIMLAVTLILGLLTDFGIIIVIAITLAAVMTFFAALWLFSLKKTYKDSIAQYDKTNSSKIEFNEDFICVEMDNGTIVKIKWSDIGFIKLFNYNVGIFASDKARALIIPLKYWNQIAKFMEDSRIIVTFYR